jgi:hypothetical protein
MRFGVGAHALARAALHFSRESHEIRHGQRLAPRSGIDAGPFERVRLA